MISKNPIRVVLAICTAASFLIAQNWVTFAQENRVKKTITPGGYQTIQEKEPLPMDEIPEVQLLRRLDLDRNQKLEPNEIPEEAKALVVRLIIACDAASAVEQGTGIIDLKKLENFIDRYLAEQRRISNLETTNQPGVSDEETIIYAINLIATYDKDENRLLNVTEFKALSEKWIECDLNGDLHLDTVEIAAGLKYALNFPRNPDGSFDQSAATLDKDRLTQLHQQILEKFSSTTPESNATREITDQSRQYAQSLLSAYDRDRSGTLDHEELSAIGDSWMEVDFDRDGKVTAEELQVRFQDYQNAERRTEAKKHASALETATSPNGSPSRNADPTAVAARPALPSSGDFRQLDSDGDGQIQMHEFASDFDADLVREFYLRDASRDGVITEREWNQFRARQNKDDSDGTNNASSGK